MIDGGAGNDTINGGAGNDQLLGGLGDDKLDGGAGDDLIDGGDGNDTITDTAGANTLKGGTGNDIITGRGTFQGGAGDDILNSGDFYSGDTYVFNLGDGKDTVADYGGTAAMGYSTAGNDTLSFGAGILASAVTVSRSGNDMVFKVSATDQVTVKDWFTSGGNAFQYIEQVQFADGTKWTVDTLRSMAISTTGTASTDTITGWDGKDVIDGGAGNDTLTFGAGIATEQRWLKKVGTDLEVKRIGSIESLAIKNLHANSFQHVAQFKSLEGRMLLESQFDALVSAMAAFAPPASGQTTLPADYQTVLNPVIAANWK